MCMWYTDAFSLERCTDSADASHADTKTIASQSHQCKMLQSDVPNQWLKLVRKLNFRDGKMQAILAFLDDLSKEESVTTRDKIICEFGQATYEYVIQFPIVLQSMPTMTLSHLRLQADSHAAALLPFPDTPNRIVLPIPRPRRDCT